MIKNSKLILGPTEVVERLTTLIQEVKNALAHGISR